MNGELRGGGGGGGGGDAHERAAGGGDGGGLGGRRGELVARVVHHLAHVHVDELALQLALPLLELVARRLHLAALRLGRRLAVHVQLLQVIAQLVDPVPQDQQLLELLLALLHHCLHCQPAECNV